MGSEDINMERTGNIIQVVNVSPAATLEQMTNLFSYIGTIVNIELYHVEKDELNFKVCFVEFSKPSCALAAHHLTTTVLIDRPLIVLPFEGETIPDQDTTLASLDDYSKHATQFNSGVISHVVTGVGGLQMFATIDPKLTSSSLPQYPNLPLTTDPSKIEEIRRTLYIGNLDSTIPSEKVMEFFNNIGEVKFIRLAGDETQPTRFAFVEYYHQSSVANALLHNGLILGSKTLKINHSNNAIVKPQHKLVSDLDDPSKRHDRHRDSSRDHHKSRHDRDRYGRSREKELDRHSSKDRHRDRDRYYDRHRQRSPVIESSRSRRSKSREFRSRRSSSRDRSKRSRSRDKTSRRRSRSRDSRRRRSRSRSTNSSRSPSRHRRSRR